MINPYGVRGWVGVELAMLKIFVKFKNYSTNDGTHMTYMYMVHLLNIFLLGSLLLLCSFVLCYCSVPRHTVGKIDAID